MLKRTISLMALFAVLLCAVGTMTEITGTGARVQVADSGTARWVQFIADPTNASAVRVGDYSVTSTVGARLAPGGGLMLPYQGQNYTLSYLYVYVANGDKVSVVWGDR